MKANIDRTGTTEKLVLTYADSRFCGKEMCITLPFNVDNGMVKFEMTEEFFGDIVDIINYVRTS